jgi:hypothetical protein
MIAVRRIMRPSKRVPVMLPALRSRVSLKFCFDAKQTFDLRREGPRRTLLAIDSIPNCA